MREHAVDLVGSLPAPEALHLGRRRELLGEERVAGVGRLLDLRGDGLVPAPRDHPRLEALFDRLPDRALGIERGLLRQIRDARAAPRGHGAGVGRLGAGEDLRERALAGAIAPDHADALAVLQGDRHALQQLAITERLADIEGGEDGHGGGRSLVRRAGDWITCPLPFAL